MEKGLANRACRLLLCIGAVLMLLVAVAFAADAENSFYAEAEGHTQWSNQYAYIYVDCGEDATLKVNVTADSEVTYRWTVNNETDEAATGDTYVLSDVQKENIVWCYVSDEDGNSATLRFYVYVNNNLTAVSENGDTWCEITVPKGGTASLKVIASADDETDMTYSWTRYVYDMESGGHQWDGEVEDADTAELEVKDLESSERYYCTVTDRFGNSVEVAFNVCIENHLTATADGTTSSYKTVGGSIGETLNLKVNVNADDMDGITYRWEKREYDSSLGYYTYEELDEDTAEMTTDPVTSSSVRYSCIVTDKYGSTANVTFEVYVENHLTVTVDGSTSTYLEKTVSLGEQVTMKVNVEADDKEGITYQWRKYTYDPSTGYFSKYEDLESDDLELTSDPVEMSMEYVFYATDKYGTRKNVIFSLEVDNHLTAEADGLPVITVEQGNTAVLKVKATADDPDGITYTWEKHVLNDNGYYYNVKTMGSTTAELTTDPVDQSVEYVCEVTDKYGTSVRVWFNVNVENHLVATANDTGRSYARVGVALQETKTLSVKVSADDTDGITYLWYKWVYNESEDYYDRIILDREAEIETEPATETVTYVCDVTDKYGTSVSVDFAVYIENNFKVTADGDRNISVASGGTATMSVTATADNMDGLTYQWYKWVPYMGGYRRTEIEGETEKSLTVSNITEDAEYYCQVTDCYGTTMGASFNITVKEDYLLGDVNGDGEVDARDLTALARHVAKIQTLDKQYWAAADVTGDDAIDASDLTKLARFVAKIITAL